MYIKICSLKRLYYLLSEGKVDVATSRAIIVANETPLRPSKLGNLNYIYAPFADVTQGEGKLTSKTARKIASYYDDISEDEDVELLYVVCDAGQSRSPSVAACLLKLEGQDDKKSIWANPQYNPNPYVYKTMSLAFGLRITDRRLRRLVHINKKALKKAIQKQKG